jgi:hypothetical protein
MDREKRREIKREKNRRKGEEEKRKFMKR